MPSARKSTARGLTLVKRLDAALQPFTYPTARNPPPGAPQTHDKERRIDATPHETGQVPEPYEKKVTNQEGEQCTT